MKIHRFFVSDLKLENNIILREKSLLHQWQKVLRFKPGQQVVLFDGNTQDKLYSIDNFSDSEAHLRHMADNELMLPNRKIYLIFSLLKKDKNDWVLQKCTEIGVSHFVPLIADRSEKTGFKLERAQKIVIEASEQCGRSDIPSVRQPVSITTVISDLTGKIYLNVAEQYAEHSSQFTADSIQFKNPVGIFIGPEGGWSEREKQLFKDRGIKQLALSNFTLRAETAAVTAAGKLLQ